MIQIFGSGVIWSCFRQSLFHQQSTAVKATSILRTNRQGCLEAVVRKNFLSSSVFGERKLSMLSTLGPEQRVEYSSLRMFIRGNAVLYLSARHFYTILPGKHLLINGQKFYLSRVTQYVYFNNYQTRATRQSNYQMKNKSQHTAKEWILFLFVCSVFQLIINKILNVFRDSSSAFYLFTVKGQFRLMPCQWIYHINIFLTLSEIISTISVYKYSLTGALKITS